MWKRKRNRVGKRRRAEGEGSIVWHGAAATLHKCQGCRHLYFPGMKVNLFCLNEFKNVLFFQLILGRALVCICSIDLYNYIIIQPIPVIII